jgi:transketolase N-terminal domain/subunit
MWPMVNGVAMANPDKIAWCLGSDGSQQEGNDSEAARLAAARNINVKLVIDDNNVTIAGHPSEYLKGYNVEKTLEVCCASLCLCLCVFVLCAPRVTGGGVCRATA